MPYLAVLCPLSCFEDAYSVAQIVEQQLNLLSKHYKIVFITTDDFKQSTEYEVRVFPRWSVFESYYSYFKRIEKQLENCFKGITHCVVHDVFFIDGFLHLNYALRELNPKVRYLVWSHSLTHELRKGLNYEPVPNATFVALTPLMVTELQTRYLTTNIVVIPHIQNPNYYRLDHEVNNFYQSLNINKYDLITTYPGRVVKPKNLHKVSYLLSKLEKDYGITSRIITVDSYSNNLNSLKIIQDIKSIEQDIKGYSSTIFTSEVFNKVKLPISHISQFNSFSNIFFMASCSESFSLTTLEAISSKLPLVLNKSNKTFQYFKEFNPLYLDFGSLSDLDNLKQLDKEVKKLVKFVQPIVKQKKKLNQFSEDNLLNEIRQWLSLP